VYLITLKVALGFEVQGQGCNRTIPIIALTPSSSSLSRFIPAIVLHNKLFQNYFILKMQEMMGPVYVVPLPY